MLNDILPYVSHMTQVVATVMGIDIEVVDANLVRIAGTGIYADNIGQSVASAGGVCMRAMSSRCSVFIENPRENELCLHCTNRSTCTEELSIYTPILMGDEVLGSIGLVCFTKKDKERVLSTRLVYTDFLEQIAAGIARAASDSKKALATRQHLDVLLQITDSNSRGIMMMNSQDRLTYINDTGREQLGLGDGSFGSLVEVRKTGNNFSHMEEFDLLVNGVKFEVIGRYAALRAGQTVGSEVLAVGHIEAHCSREKTDAEAAETPLNMTVETEFASVLVFDSKPRFTAMLSQLDGNSNNSQVLSSIIGDSRVIRNLKKRVLQIANTSSSVLITGESGTGKEMFARAIHAASDRKDKPFIPINCGAIPDALLESELFGYVKGAFTGANPTGRMGKFELANTGVLFLDEIGSMPLYLQVKLLRVLQERTFSRLGSNKLIEVDVRIISATNEKLPDLIDQRMFRDDLYYRLNVIPLEIPPLRERKEDIPILAEFFLDRYCNRFSKPPARLSPRLLDMLSSYSWPGNIREFENCIEYMVNIHEGGPLQASVLPPKVRAAASGEVVSVGSQSRDSGGILLDRPAVEPIVPLYDLEQRAVHNAVAHFGNSTEGKKLAAEALGIGIATLYRKLKGQ